MYMVLPRKGWFTLMIIEVVCESLLWDILNNETLRILPLHSIRSSSLYFIFILYDFIKISVFLSGKVVVFHDTCRILRLIFMILSRYLHEKLTQILQFVALFNDFNTTSSVIFPSLIILQSYCTIFFKIYKKLSFLHNLLLILVPCSH